MSDSNSSATRLRVMIVDGSSLHRRLLTDTLAQHEALEVVGTAINARTGLAKLSSYQPDVIAIDMVSDGVEGLDLARQLRRDNREIGIVVLTENMDKVNDLMQAGNLGPCHALVRSADGFTSRTGQEPADCILSAAPASWRRQHRPVSPHSTASTPPASATDRNPPKQAATSPVKTAPLLTARKTSILAIGTSTGGPNALGTMLPMLPANFPIPIIIVQHMPSGFTKSLAESLDSKCEIRVSEACEGDELQPGHALVAPGGKHLGIKQHNDKVIATLSMAPPEHSCRPSVDYTLRSVAKIYGKQTLSVIMTGMGEDGFASCRLLHDAGAQLIAQDEATSTVFGMPRGLVETGIANLVAPLDEIADGILCAIGRRTV